VGRGVASVVVVIVEVTVSIWVGFEMLVIVAVVTTKVSV
jgi:hypothetical protein